MIANKQTLLQIFGSIMKRPSLLFQTETYNLTLEDFNNSFEKYIFGAIYNIAQNKAESISVVDVDDYLSRNPTFYGVFEKNKGVEFLQDAEDISNVENFHYYYTGLKKSNALRDLRALGINTDSIYPSDTLILEDNTKQIEAYEKMTVQDIFQKVKASIAGAESRYGCSDMEVEKANANLKELLEDLNLGASVGKSLQGKIYNTVTRGATKGKYYLLSAGSGVGKTRTMVGHCCSLAYPVRYNPFLRQWEHNGFSEKVLYVATEQKPFEIKRMILAYLSGINQDKINYGQCNEEENEILQQCIQVMDAFEDNFIIARLPEPNIGQVKNLVRDYALNHQVEYVFYDYIFTTPSLLGEFRDLGIRNDQVLRMLSTELKDLAAELQIFVMSATQITGDLKEVKGIRNELCLRDSKSIPDKADVASINARVTQEELNLLSAFCEKSGVFPTQVCDIYKNRDGRYTECRIWSRVDLGTLRREDLFITDAYLNPIDDFSIVDFVFDEEFGKYDNIISMLNINEIKEKPVKENYDNCKNNNEAIIITEKETIKEEPQENNKIDWDDLL